MSIAEPTTTLTDYALAALTLAMGASLARQARSTRHAGRWLWALAFVATGLGALLGATSHGFGPRLSAAAQRSLWVATLALLAVANGAFLAAAALDFAQGATQRWLLFAAGSGLVLVLRLVVQQPTYRLVILDSALTMVLVLALVIVALRHGPLPAAAWIVAAIAVAAVGAVIQGVKIAPHPAFNHNDLYHVLQLVAFALLYRGVQRLPTG